MVSLLLAIIYLCFISLGLPDSLLGSAWPRIYTNFNVPVSYMGIIVIIISFGTITSSILSDRMTQKLGSGLLTAVSIGLTAVGLVGFATSNAFWLLCIWAIPYGLGAGGIDAALNNYVAIHFKSKHMSWLHAMWGIGASVSPMIMSYALSGGNWQKGYWIVFIIQAVICAVVFLSLPIWKKVQTNTAKEKKEQEIAQAHLGVKDVFKLKGSIFLFLALFAYCACEQTCLQWSASFLSLYHHLTDQESALFSSLPYLGIMTGRLINGFLTMKFSDRALTRVGCGIIVFGIILLAIPGNYYLSIAAIAIIGLGCAPIYPSLIRCTPDLFGEGASQAMIGIEMAFAYTSNVSMSPLFGVIAQYIGVNMLPYYLLIFVIMLFFMHEITLKLRKQAGV